MRMLLLHILSILNSDWLQKCMNLTPCGILSVFKSCSDHSRPTHMTSDNYFDYKANQNDTSMWALHAIIWCEQKEPNAIGWHSQFVFLEAVKSKLYLPPYTFTLEHLLNSVCWRNMQTKKQAKSACVQFMQIICLKASKLLSLQCQMGYAWCEVTNLHQMPKSLNNFVLACTFACKYLNCAWRNCAIRCTKWFLEICVVKK